jgi:uncharacterized membrane protein YeaQ/YmgE (transglycosylase-associated protein family)
MQRGRRIGPALHDAHVTGGVEMNQQSKSIVSWIIIGLLAGGLASIIVGGGGGLLGWLIAGLIGSVVGGFLAQQLKINLNFGNAFLEQLVISLGGAIVVLIVARIITG